MWWGGSGEDDKGHSDAVPGGTTGQQKEVDPVVVQQELGDLKDQFEEQQALIGKLKEMLKKGSVAEGREKEPEDYAARLANLKPRSSRLKSSSSASEQNFVEPTSTEISCLHGKESQSGKENIKEDVGNRTKVLLLRKQLEENRARFEKQQKENAEKRSTMDDMKRRIDKLMGELEQKDQVIHSMQGSEEDPVMQRLYQQMLYKDNNILELTQKVTSLEDMLREQHERLQEKERVIESRTEAVALVAQDRDMKAMKMVEELEETRIQMKEMQKEFIKKEQEWKIEKEVMSKEVLEKNKKMGHLEDAKHRLEGLRFELSARNAELQEKIVALQSEVKNLKRELETQKSVSEETNLEMMELKQKLVKAEVHGIKKLKVMEKQVRSLKEGNIGEQILQLNNRIAELEEDKGNLQLKLVDCDEVKIINEKLSSQCGRLEEKIGELNHDLELQLSSITRLETDKIHLVEGINERENRLFDLEIELGNSKVQLEEIGQAKVTLELKLCEMEEQNESKESVGNENESYEKIVEEKGLLEEKLHELIKKKKEVEMEREVEIERLNDWKERVRKTEEEMEKWKKDGERLLNILTDKENSITTLVIQNDEYELKCVELETQNKSWSAEMVGNEQQLEDARNKLLEEIAKSEEFSQKVLELENYLTSKDEQLVKLQDRLDTMKKFISDQTRNVDDLEQKISETRDILHETDSSLREEREKRLRVEVKYAEVCQQIHRLQNAISEKEEDLQDRCAQVATISERFNSLVDECDHLNFMLNEKDNRLHTLETESETHLTRACSLSNELTALENSRKQLEEQLTVSDTARMQMEEQLMASDGARKQLEEQLQCLQTTLIDANNKLEKSDNKLIGLEEYSQNIVAKMESMQIEIENWNHQVLFLQQECKQYNEERDQLFDRIKTLEEINSEQEQQTISLSHQLHDATVKYEEKLEAMTEQLKIAEGEKNKFKEDFQSLYSDAEQKTNEIEKWQFEVSEKEEKFLFMQKKLEEMTGNLEQKEIIIHKANENNEQLHSQMMTMHTTEQELLSCHQSLEQLESNLTKTQEELQTTQESLVMYQNSYAEYQTQYDALVVYVTQLEESAQNMTASLQSSQADGVSHETQIQEIVLQAEETERSLRAEICRLNVEAENEVQEKLELNASINQLKEQLQVLNQQLEVSSTDYTESKKEHQLLCDQLTEREHQLELLEQQLTDLQSELNQMNNLSLMKESKTYEVTLNLQSQLETLHQQLASLTEERNQLQEQLHIAVCKLQEFEKTVMEMKEAHSFLNDDCKKKESEIDKLQKELANISQNLQEKMEAFELEGRQAVDKVGKLQQLLTAAHDNILLSESTSNQTQQLNTENRMDSVSEERHLAEYFDDRTKIQLLEEKLSQASLQILSLQKEIKESEAASSAVVSSTQETILSPNLTTWDSVANSQLSYKDICNIPDLQQLPAREEIEIIQELPQWDDADLGSASAGTEGIDVPSLQYQLSWYEEQWTSWTGHYNDLQTSYQEALAQINILEEKLQVMNVTNDVMQESLGLNSNVDCHEDTKVTAEQDDKVSVLQTENSYLREEVSLLQMNAIKNEQLLVQISELNQAHSDMQTSWQEAQAKSDNSWARILELELIVQSAESEIERLRSQLSSSNSQDSSRVQSDSSRLQMEVEGYKGKAIQFQHEVQALEDTMENLRRDVAHLQAEKSHLESELEVMEGENERLRDEYAIMEGEINSVRQELTQAQQFSELEKESLDCELQRKNDELSSIQTENRHLNDEVKRMSELNTSAESEITRQFQELQRYISMEAQLTELRKRLSELQTQAMVGVAMEEEVDWSVEGKVEEHYQESQPAENQKLLTELSVYKEKLIELEKERNSLFEELQTSKVKNGKLLQKLKQLQKEFDSARKRSTSDLDRALEDEYRAQMSRVEGEKEKMLVAVQELERERNHLKEQIDVLNSAQERYLELKESQDSSVQLLTSQNQDLQSQLHAMEWKLSEVEASEGNETSLFSPSRETSPKINDSTERELQLRMKELENELDKLSGENDVLRQEILDGEDKLDATEEKLVAIAADNESLQSMTVQLNEAKTKALRDTETYKANFIELNSQHETLLGDQNESNEKLRMALYEYETMKAAYNSLFDDCNDLKDVNDGCKHDFAVLQGERERLLHEVESLKGQLDALREEEEEETIRALQDQCSMLQEQILLLHEETTALQIQNEEAKEKSSRISSSLQENVEIQNLLRDELMKKTEELEFTNVTLMGQEREINYLKAELASLKVREGKGEQKGEATDLLSTELATPGDSEVFISQLPSMMPESQMHSAMTEIRCQQLTLEINKLLEERDALQLKLSSALRQNQDLSRELNLSQHLPSPTNISSEVDDKLAELRELNDSMEQRAMMDLHQMHHPSILPRQRSFSSGGSEAWRGPSVTRPAERSLTRESQGTSMTLFDWIMGKSPPKVMHV